MLFSGFTSPRRLALLAVAIFIVAIIFLQSSQYHSDYLPNTSDGLSGFHAGAGSKSSLEEDKESSKVETPSEGDVKTPIQEPEKAYTPPTRPETIETSSSTNAYQKATATSTSILADHSTLPTHALNISLPSPSSIEPIVHESPEEIQSKVQSLLKTWTPPLIRGHWPPYESYQDRDYDPNMWEGFDWDNDFYTRNGVKKLREDHSNVTAVPYSPYPDYSSSEYQMKWKGHYSPCEGARGGRLNESDEDIVKAYPIVPAGFPQVAIGDANVTGIDLSYCFDRYHRYGPYGYGQGQSEGADDWERPAQRPHWPDVQWGGLQDQCLLANKARFKPHARQSTVLAPGTKMPSHVDDSATDEKEPTLQGFRPRTALLIRSWDDYNYTANDLEAIRAMITELSLLSGGEYQVFLFVNIKDKNSDFYTNSTTYKNLMKTTVPKELQGITILWSEKVCESWYPKVEDWQVYWHQFMPLQWFSKTHPEFDYVWNWETDARYTGNHYQLLEGVAEFSRKYPRKYMWERNQRFYFPSAHGSYDQWLNDTDAAIEEVAKSGNIEPVWGALPYDKTAQNPIGPKPPHSMDEDAFQWGVGEEADLVTLQPIWDPAHTEWTFRNKIWNFLPGIRPHFTEKDPLDDEFYHPEFMNIPRRTYINTLSRFSKRQLHAMHLENLAGRTTQAEMWPATVALHHGLKAVYAPHPIWTDRRWPGWYMDATFNADGGKPARWGAEVDSVYNHDREHNFKGWSWYYASEFPKTLYRRWLGWSATVGPEEQFPNNPLRKLGGGDYEDVGMTVQMPGRTADGSQAAPAGGESFGGREVFVGGKGRMCLPPMLLHPVKKVYETAEDEAAS